MTHNDEDGVRRIEELVRQLDRIPDLSHRELANELVSAVLALHGAAIENMMELVAEAGPPGSVLFRKFANDPAVASVLVLHGLHPDDMETRVRQVLAKQATHAELLGVFEGTVRVRVPAGGCNSASTTVQLLEAALRNAVPDAAEIIVTESPLHGGFVPLTALDPFFSAPLSKG